MDIDPVKVDEIIHKCPELIRELQAIEQKIMELRQSILKAVGGDDE